MVDHGIDLATAVSVPRFHEQGLPDVVMDETGGIVDADRKALEAMGYTFKERPHIADAPAIGWAQGRGWARRSRGGWGAWRWGTDPRAASVGFQGWGAFPGTPP